MARTSSPSRRAFLRSALAVPFAGALGASPGCAADGVPILGPWPARPGADRMSLWCLTPERRLGPVEIRPLGDGTRRSASFELEGEGVYVATFEGLSPDTEYAFSFGAREGSFRTLPAANGRVRLAFGADIHPASAPYRAFDAVLERLPHLFVGLGDHVYADLDPSGPVAPTDAAYRALYRRTWDDAHLDACWSHVPSLLVWDDHETANDYDGSFVPPGAEPARRAYERYQRSRSPSSDAWTILDVGPASLFVLDTRSYRSPNLAPDGPSKTMLGAAQRAALLAFIADADPRVKIVASPTPFHPYADTGLDAWAHGFDYERGLVLAAIEGADPSRFVLVSGDQHWPAVVRNALPGGGSVLELQCTPTAAFARQPPLSPSSDFLYVGDGSVGFGLLEIDATAGAPKVGFAWIGADGGERFAIDLI